MDEDLLGEDADPLDIVDVPHHLPSHPGISHAPTDLESDFGDDCGPLDVSIPCEYEPALSLVDMIDSFLPLQADYSTTHGTVSAGCLCLALIWLS